FLHGVVATVHEAVVGRTSSRANSYGTQKRADSAHDRIRKGRTQPLRPEKPGGTRFEGLRGDPHTITHGIDIGEETQDTSTVGGPRRKRVEMEQVVPRMQTAGAPLLFHGPVTGVIECPAVCVRAQGTREKFHTVSGKIAKEFAGGCEPRGGRVHAREAIR